MLSELNQLFPATRAPPRSSGAWNRLSAGKNLPRTAGLLLSRLAECYPHAAASYQWPLWSLAGYAALSLAEIHWLMVELPIDVRCLLMIDVFPNGRVLRSAGFLRTELEVVADLRTFNGLMATVGLLREAELYQDSIAYRRGYELLLGQLHLLPVAFGSKVLADRFAEFLRRRFCSMTIILEGAYEGKPRALGAAAQAFPVRLRPPDPVNAESLFRVKAEWCGYTSETIQALTDMWRDSMKQVNSPPGDRRRRRSLLKKR